MWRRHPMVPIRLLLAALAFAAAAHHPLPLDAQTRNIPSGWFKAGKSPDDYDVGTDQSVKRSGSILKLTVHE